ncbi:MAG: carboxypeptidase-like regulatory domain-containing protein [Acidobacteriota bacterium]|nr:carboxypeptidase-like regulatory domain-containing protein [Acidobacteriota bacterium]
MRVFGVLAFTLVIGVGSIAAGQSPQPSTPGQTAQPGQPAPGPPSRTPARPLRPGELAPKGTAVLRGQVLAAGSGTPIRRAQVRAMSMDGRGGGVTGTDAEGRYEIKDLPGGRYSISATKTGFISSQYGQRRPGEPGTPIEITDGMAADKLNFTLARGGVIAGRILDDTGDPMAGVQVAAMRYGFMAGSRRLIGAGSEGGNDRTDDQGGFRLYGLPPGDYYVSATYRNMMILGPEINNTQADGYAPTYFPGTPNLAEAQRVSPKAGQEVSGVIFSLMVSRLARISGRALNSRGEPATRATVMLMPAETMSGMFMTMGNAMVGADGAFQIPNVAAGRYLLNIRPMGMPTPTDEFAALPVTVGTEDIDNVIVSTAVGGTARGVVMSDTGEPLPVRPEQIQLFAGSVDPTVMSPSMGGPPRVNDDFSFELTSLFDRRIIRGGMMGAPGWSLKAVRFDGEDITDEGMEFVPGRNIEGLQVVFTQKITDLSGLVTDERGKPVLDASVVIFPANRDKWRAQSRYVRTLRPDTQGRYNIKSLPPGEDYLVIAVQNLESGQGGDPEFLARAKEEAKPFTLNEGETKSVDVKLSTLVP